MRSRRMHCADCVVALDTAWLHSLLSLPHFERCLTRPVHWRAIKCTGQPDVS